MFSFNLYESKGTVFDIKNSAPLKIVIHSEFGGRSHIKGILEIGDELINRGHQVTYVTLEHNLRFLKGYNIGNYSLGRPKIDESLILKETKDILLSEDKTNSMERLTKFMSTFWTENYETTYLPFNEYLTNEKPDLIVCDFITYPCKDLAKNLKIPMITGFQTIDGFGIINEASITTENNYGPLYTKDMSFYQRFKSQVIAPIRLIISFRNAYNQLDIVRSKHNINPTMERFGDLKYSLAIANTFVGFEPATRLPPSVLQLGPILSEDKDILEPELNKFLNLHRNTLFIAFGSNSVLNSAITQKILEASLLAIEENTIDGIIWGLGHTNQDNFPIEVNDGKGGKVKVHDLFEGKNDKVKLLSWAPQVSVLNHKSTKVFISHGGLESVFEAIYSGTPVVCVALFGDQPRNAAKLEEIGTGIFVNKYTFTPESLNEQLRSIIEDKDDKFKSNLSRMKTISHHNSRRLSYAANVFEQHAYTAKACRKYEPYDPNSNLSPCELKHLIPVSEQMSFISANGIDIYGTAILILSIGFGLSFYFLYHLSMFPFKYLRNASNKLKME
ncbi:UDP-Glycosyltransferase/glycogen phosphorylase [Neoconidiobolus thromboides FSU 785]|nr:UDP-Glycosyltransferase/glycogen phosphorylase [Neoconidiobolus thromboides FSU 785]